MNTIPLYVVGNYLTLVELNSLGKTNKGIREGVNEEMKRLVDSRCRKALDFVGLSKLDIKKIPGGGFLVGDFLWDVLEGKPNNFTVPLSRLKNFEASKYPVFFCNEYPSNLSMMIESFLGEVALEWHLPVDPNVLYHREIPMMSPLQCIILIRGATIKACLLFKNGGPIPSYVKAATYDGKVLTITNLYS
jgi:hypothetical protein